jgi:hypothetical protein
MWAKLALLLPLVSCGMVDMADGEPEDPDSCCLHALNPFAGWDMVKVCMRDVIPANKCYAFTCFAVDDTKYVCNPESLEESLEH